MSTRTRTRTRTAARNQFLSDLLTTAVEGGINYWASVSDYHWSDEHPETTTVRVYDEEDEGNYTLHYEGTTVTVDDIARGLRLALAAYPQRRELALANRTNGEDGDFDAEDADVVLQFALFGELVYG